MSDYKIVEAWAALTDLRMAYEDVCRAWDEIPDEMNKASDEVGTDYSFLVKSFDELEIGAWAGKMAEALEVMSPVISATKEKYSK